MLKIRIVALLAALAIVGAACGGGDSDDNAGGGGGGSDASACPIGTLAKRAATEKPVEIAYWNSMTRENADLLKELADDFNASQKDVRVKLVNQTSYDDTLTKFKASLTGGNTPDLVQLEDNATQAMVDSQATIPAQACVEADDYDLSDDLQRVIDFYTVEDTLWPMPFNVSNPVLYYSRSAFREAGLDPDEPPKTLDDVLEYSKKIVDSNTAPHGFALVLNAWFLETWLATANQTYVNNDNGRTARTTQESFNNADGKAIFEWIDEMVGTGLAENVGSPKGGNINHYLAVANGSSAMTVDTSAAIGTILDLLGKGQYAGVEFDVAPLPVLGTDGGTFVAGGSNHIVKGTDPAKVEAAWEFAKYLNSPEVQAKWAATGYIPIRRSATESEAVKKLWAERPQYKVAYDQLAGEATGPATAGPVIGDYPGVTNAIQGALESMITSGKSPEAALQQAADEANKAIADYNQRVGE